MLIEPLTTAAIRALMRMHEEIPGVFVEDPMINTALIVCTAAQYLGLLILAGLGLYARLVQKQHGPLDRSVHRILFFAFLVAVLASLAVMVITALRIAGVPWSSVWMPVVWAPAIHTPTVIALLLVVGGGTLAVRAAGAQDSPLTRWVQTIGTALVLAAPVLTGHTRLREPLWAMVSADYVHLIAASIWTGGLLGLILTLRQLNKAGRPALEGARLVSRFSGFAAGSVLLLGISGTLMAILIIDDLPGVATSPYGRTLLLKLGLVGAVVGLAAWNKIRLFVSIEGLGAEGWRSLHRVLVYQVALLFVVALATGLLTNSSPAHSGH